MRMKLFSAATLDQAMEQMRVELGPDAVVLSTRSEDNFAEVRAAVERPLNHRFAPPSFSEARPSFDESTRERMEDVLTWHGAPDTFAERVAVTGVKLMGANADAAPAMAAGLEGVTAFAPIHADSSRAIMIVGAPGAGKTSVAAKLATARPSMQGGFRPVCADFDAAGGHARLSAFAGRADIPLFRTPESLRAHIAQRTSEGARLVIDAPSFNPLNPDDMNRLAELVELLNVEPILALSAEGHPQDLEDNARAYRNAGVRRTVLTKLDVVRRRGGVFAAISSARLSIAQLSLTHHIQGGLIPATPLRIARLLLETAPETGAAKTYSFKGAA
ncbi:MAG: GTP-binding protein [Hirschia sp.]|nr:GTP-binding protein [Hirschia sp.]MBF17678.1 GTP-binding protein [Hirschia sp.]